MPVLSIWTISSRSHCQVLHVSYDAVYFCVLVVQLLFKCQFQINPLVFTQVFTALESIVALW